MDKEKFNVYCASVMGWVSCSCSASVGKNLDDTKRFNAEAWSTPPSDEKSGCIKHFKSDYSPHDDLNQMAEVFDELYKCPQKTENVKKFLSDIYHNGISNAMRDFVISTMPVEQLTSEVSDESN